jgi:signal peptidase I
MKDAGWRENVEVFLVAIVIAAGVRAYFLQPFKIPTGSMQPTLFGIVGTPTATSPPNPLTRAVQLVWLGRHSIDVTAKEG